MSIQRKPKNPSGIDAFIAGAPDHMGTKRAEEAETPYNKGVKKGKRRQITHTLVAELLRDIDKAAAKSGQTRAAFINMALYRAVKGDPFAT